jgi:hypothetical protein
VALSDAAPFAVAAWDLDEASGTRVDQVGANDLTDNNTVGSAAGMFGNAADFEKTNSEHLSIADNADLSMGDVDFSIVAWVQLESKPDYPQVVSKWDYESGTGTEYTLEYHLGSDRFRFAMHNGTSQSTCVANNFGSPSTATWYLLVATYNATTDTMTLSVNAGTRDTQSHSSGTQTAGSPSFHLGRLTTADSSSYWDGLIDDVVILKGYVLSADEEDELYNSGTGVAFADWDAGGGATSRPLFRRFMRFFRGR